MKTPCYQHDSYQAHCADCRDMSCEDAAPNMDSMEPGTLVERLRSDAEYLSPLNPTCIDVVPQTNAIRAELQREAAGHIEATDKALRQAREALLPFAHVAERIREAAKDERWLEQVLFYMGTDDDPTKWSLTGRAFDRARQALTLLGDGK